MKVSPIAEYLLSNNAVSKKIDKNTVHFYNSQNEYLGTMSKGIYKNSRFISIRVFDKNIKPLFSKVIKLYQDKIHILDKNTGEISQITQKYLKNIEEKDFSNNILKKTIKENNITSKYSLVDEYLPSRVYTLDEKIKYSNPKILLSTESKF